MVLTVCPLSNVRLRVVERMADHPLPRLLKAGLRVTINSDDPAYFGGGMLANFIACHEAFGWSKDIFIQLAGTAIESAFISDDRRLALQRQLSGIT
jgi:adenosine deaminase